MHQKITKEEKGREKRNYKLKKTQKIYQLNTICGPCLDLDSSKLTVQKSKTNGNM